MKKEGLFMRDDEKMFNLGLCMLIGVVCLIVFLQVCYRVQNSNLAYVRGAMDDVKYKYASLETRFSNLSSGDSLRQFVLATHPNAVVVSYSKTVHIDDIPMETK